LNLGKIASGNNGGGLVIDTNLETGRAPVDELNGALGLDGGNGGIDVFGDDITTVQHAASHVFTMAGVAFDHLVAGLKAHVGDFSDRQLFMVSLFSRDDGGIGGEGKVDAGVGDQVGLEFGQIDVEGTIEAEGSSDGRHNLGHETVQVGVGRSVNVEVAAADIVDGLVINHESGIRVLEGGVAGQDGVVGFHDGG
jgi:hypothetical protein